MLPEGWTSVSLENELMTEVDQIIQDHPEMRIKNKADFVRKAVVEKIERVRSPDETIFHPNELEQRFKELQEKRDQRIQKLEGTIEKLQKQVDRISELEKKEN